MRNERFSARKQNNINLLEISGQIVITPSRQWRGRVVHNSSRELTRAPNISCDSSQFLASISACRHSDCLYRRPALSLQLSSGHKMLSRRNVYSGAANSQPARLCFHGKPPGLPHHLRPSEPPSVSFWQF